MYVPTRRRAVGRAVAIARPIDLVARLVVGGPSQGWVSALLGKKTKLVVGGFIAQYSKSNNVFVLRLVCLLALSPPGQHERTIMYFFMLCAGPIAGRSAVLAVRKCCGYRVLVCALVRCAKEAGFFLKAQKVSRAGGGGDSPRHAWSMGRSEKKIPDGN